LNGLFLKLNENSLMGNKSMLAIQTKNQTAILSNVQQEILKLYGLCCTNQPNKAKFMKNKQHLWLRIDD
jgi:hypothetical protein